MVYRIAHVHTYTLVEFCTGTESGNINAVMDGDMFLCYT